jgi:hypothetical protein
MNHLLPVAVLEAMCHAAMYAVGRLINKVRNAIDAPVAFDTVQTALVATFWALRVKRHNVCGHKSVAMKSTG